MANRKGKPGGGEASQFFNSQDVESQNDTLQATSERVSSYQYFYSLLFARVFPTLGL